MDQDLDINSQAKFILGLINQRTDYKCAEFYFNKNKYSNIEVEENQIKNSEIGGDNGVSLRVIDNRGSLGFSMTNILKQSALEKMVGTAFKMMKNGTEDSDFINLPSKFEKYPNVKGLFDPEIKNIQIEDSVKYIQDLIEICKNDENAISQSAGFSTTYSKTYIFNTNGIEITGKDTVATLVSNMIVKDKVSKETAFGYDWQSARDLKLLNASEIAVNSLEDAKRNLNRIKIKNMKCPLILTPNGTINFILSPIASAVNAEAYQYKRTFLINQRNQVIGAENLTIEDNALIDGGTGSAIFDAEGVPCKNKKIFEKGKFLEILHNSYTAGKDGIESTGNAARRSYDTLPVIGITNLIMQSGEVTKDDLISEIKEGIILDSTGDSPNIATGDFSGLALHANMIRNGEIKEPLNETMFAINLLDLFKKIELISKDFKVYGAYQAPYVKISDVQFIGAA